MTGSDLIVGAIDASPPLRRHAGTVSVFFGRASGLARSPDVVLEGAAENAEFGASVASIGDINGDGYADIAIGSPGASPGGIQSAGSAFVYRGGSVGPVNPATQVIVGDSMYARLGASVAGAGDVDGDGLADFAVAAPGQSVGGMAATGVASVYGGSLAGRNFALLRRLEGSLASTGRGRVLSTCGDVNADGFADLLINGSESTGGVQRATIEVLHGSSQGFVPTSYRVLSASGAPVAGRLGDVDKDGYSDIVIGSAINNSASIFRGSRDGIQSTASWTLTSTTMSGEFGYAIAQ